MKERRIKMTDYEKHQLEQLKTIKNSINRKIEFMMLGYTDNLQTTFQDKNIIEKSELVDLLLDTAIKYLEEKENRK